MASIITRTGDQGTTSLADGTRVPKGSPWIEAYGTLDELTSALGLARSLGAPAEVDGELDALQRRLHGLAAQLAYRGAPPAGLALTAADVARLEALGQRLEQALPALRGFIVPGGEPPAAALHLARTICRRMERRVLEIDADFDARPALLAWVNRLSDVLFLLARRCNQLAGRQDTLI